MIVRTGVAFAGAILFAAGKAAAQADPGAMGPHAVTTTEYGSFTTSVSLGSIPAVEVLAEVRYPTDLVNGPYPLVILLHGRHYPCYNTTTGAGTYQSWPCPSGYVPVPSYKGYDYAATVLASHGMIVASISADAINQIDNNLSGYGMSERGLLIQHHLDKWQTFSTTGGSPFGTTFVGRVDMTRVGTMGHSRGGEGVIWNFERNKALGSPYGIKAVLPIEPVDFFGHFVNNVPVGVLLGYCDGDVYELPGRAYVDDARYAVSTDDSPKYTFTTLGANHNFFNRYWTPDQFTPATSDDWTDQTDPQCKTAAATRLTSAQQRGVGIAYMSAFFRRQLLDADYDGILRGDVPPPPSAQTTAIYAGYVPGAVDRRDLNRLAVTTEISTNTMGGAATQSGLSPYALCGDGIGPACGASRSIWDPYDRLSSVKLWWAASGATYANQLPAGLLRDVSNFGSLQFRVAIDYNDAQNLAGQDQDFTVRLTDATGVTASLSASTYEKIFFPPGSTANRTAVLNTARLPMSAFVGVDTANIATVTFIFNKKPQGGIFVSDLSFADEGMTTAEKWLISSGT